MRNVLIAGAGQSGLMLGLYLRSRRYDVTILTNRSAADVAGGQIMSTQVMFGESIELERSAVEHFWQHTVPGICNIEFTQVDPDGRRRVNWTGRLGRSAESIDQRTKFARWMQAFEEKGGRLEIGPLTVECVEELDRAGQYDLVVIAAASSDLAGYFPVDDQKRPASRGPRRTLSAVYLHGVEPSPGCGQFIRVPGCGEIITAPALTGDIECHTMLVEAVPGGSWDVFGEVVDDPPGHVARMVDMLAQFAPAVHERFRHGVLTDPGGRLVGAVTPVVRQPVVTLPSGRTVVGMGDTVCRMDPLGAQGANTAVRCAFGFGLAIVQRGHRPFDQEWMSSVADDCWTKHAYPALGWTDLLLDPSPPLEELLVAAEQDSRVGNALVSGFAYPAEVPGLAWPADT